MASLRCRIGPMDRMRFKRKTIVASLGRLRIVKESFGLYSVMHAPTGLALHQRLMDRSLPVARRAIVLAGQLDAWDWSDPEEVRSRPYNETQPLWTAFVTIAEMAEAR